MNKLVSRELPDWKRADVTKPPFVVTKPLETTKPLGGRPPKFGKAMTAAERKRLQRGMPAASKS